MPKNRCQIPRPYGAWLVGALVSVGCVSDGFSFGCEIVALLLLTGSVMEGQCFTARDQCGSVGALFRVLVGFLFGSSCIQWVSAHCLDIYGEFDPGSGRTLAACLTHASRTVKPFGVDQWRTGE